MTVPALARDRCHGVPQRRRPSSTARRLATRRSLTRRRDRGEHAPNHRARRHRSRPKAAAPARRAAARRSARHFALDRLGIERVDLVEPDDLRLLGKAVTVKCELVADRAVGAGDVVEGAVDQMKDHCAALDMAEKAGADPDPLARALDQSGEVGQDELLVMQPHDAELRLQGRERVVGDLRPGMRDRGEKGRLAGVGQADETGIGDQLQAQPDPGLAARPAGIGAARRAIGRALVMRVAETAVAALQKDEPLAGAGEVGEHLAVLGIHDLGADRNLQDQIFASRAGALAPGAGPAVVRPEMLPIAKVDQGIEIIGRGKDDVAASAAVTAVGAAELDEFLAAKARAPAPAVTALQVDLALVEKLHLAGSTQPSRVGRISLTAGKNLFRSARGTVLRSKICYASARWS